MFFETGVAHARCMAVGDLVFEEGVGGDLVPVDLDWVSWGLGETERSRARRWCKQPEMGVSGRSGESFAIVNNGHGGQNP